VPAIDEVPGRQTIPGQAALHRRQCSRGGDIAGGASQSGGWQAGGRKVGAQPAGGDFQRPCRRGLRRVSGEPIP